jgi:hypothetical protein
LVAQFIAVQNNGKVFQAGPVAGDLVFADTSTCVAASTTLSGVVSGMVEKDWRLDKKCFWLKSMHLEMSVDIRLDLYLLGLLQTCASQPTPRGSTQG